MRSAPDGAVRAALIGLAIVFLQSPNAAHAQEFDITGQIRPRLEHRDTLSGFDDRFTSMRVRLGVAAELDPKVHAFIQLQDVRIWGEELGTLADFSADQLDLHQGYLEVRPFGTSMLSARIGRQELSFGGERLIGTVNWAQQGRSFDAARISVSTSTLRLDGFAAQVADATTGTHEGDEYFLGMYGTQRFGEAGSLDFYGLVNHVEASASDASDATDQLTFGGRWFGERGRLRYRAEFAAQAGDRAGRDVFAMLLGARVGTTLLEGAGDLTLWYDFLSGNEPGRAQLRAFDTLFATNHPLYGFADHFTDIPRDTGGRGLQDFALKTAYRPTGDLRIAVDLHAFRAARGSDLVSSRFGEEIDLTLGYRVSEHLNVVSGASYLFVGDGMRAIGRALTDASWAYLMLDAAF